MNLTLWLACKAIKMWCMHINRGFSALYQNFNDVYEKSLDMTFRFEKKAKNS